MTRPRNRLFAWTITLLFTLAWGRMLCAEPEPPPPLDRERALRLAGEVDSERYPTADGVILDERRVVHYAPDGTYVQWHEAYIKILTEEARRHHRTLSSHFTIPYQRGPEDCRIDVVEIIKPDGSSVEVDVEAQSRVMINPQSMAQNIYNPNQRLVRVNIAGLEVGDVLRFVLFDRVVHPRMADTWSTYAVFEGTYPIVRKSLEVLAPDERPLASIALLDPVQDTVTYEQEHAGGGVWHRWTARDVPRMFPEPNMPTPHTVLQRLLASTVPDWESVSSWYWELSEPRFGVSEALREEVLRLTEGLETRDERIRALFTFVSQRIRYMGITLETVSPGYEPREVSETFEMRHGVCRDKAALLVVMLREAGIEAYPTLIHTGPRKDFEVPLPYFNHAIVAVREPDGSWLLMDPTDETTSQLMPAYLSDKSYLVATPEGDTLRLSPIVPAEENMMRIRTDAHMKSGGRVSATTVLDFEGVNDQVYRRLLAGRNPDERNRLIEGIIKRALPEAIVHRMDLTPRDLQDTTVPLRIEAVWDSDHMLVEGSRVGLLPAPALGETLGMANFIIGRTGLDERKYPLVTEMACGVDEKIRLDLPEDFPAFERMPSYNGFESPTLAWRPAIARSANRVEWHKKLVLKATEYAPGEYAELKELLRRIEQDRRKAPVFHMPGSTLAEPDSRLLEVQVDYTLHDAHRWREERTVRREILTYAGKKKHAELKLHYNPAWDEVELTRGEVVTASGERRAISPQEVNIMDAAWVGGAPRYPAGKTLVASFPAVEPGSVIEFSYVWTASNRPFFSAREHFRLTDPIQRKTVRVEVPGELALHVFPHMPGHFESEVVTCDETGARRYTWRAEDVPGVIPEDFTPPWHTYNPSVSISSGDLSDYAALVYERLIEAASGQSGTLARTAGLVQDQAEPLERLRAVRDFLATSIRAAGPSLHKLPLSELTPADRTLADGYGHRADRALLAYAMLRAAGFEPEFVLASTQPMLDELLASEQAAPSRSFFSSLLVRVAHPAGEGHLYLNQGDQYGHLAANRFDGRAGLVLPGGVVERIEAVEPSLERRAYDVRILPGGTVHMVRASSYYGTAFGREKKRYAEMNPEELRRHFLEMVADQSQAAVAVGDLHTDFTDYPGQVEFTVEMPGYVVVDPPYAYFELPGTLAGLLRLRTPRRVNPFYHDTHNRRSIHMRVRAPASSSVEIAPETFRHESLAGQPARLHQTHRWQTDDSGLLLELEFEADLPPAIYSPSAYPDLVERLQRLSNRRNATILFKNEK